MIDVSDAFKSAWLNGKQKFIQLEFSDGTAIDNDGVVMESFSLTQTLCDESQLVFGLTSSAEFSIQVFNTGKQFKGLSVVPTLYVNVDGTQYSMSLGTYKIDEDARSDDRTYRTLIGHDALYEVLHADYSSWYNSLTLTTLKNFRDAFFTHVGITQETEILANDNMTLVKKSEVSSLSGAEIIRDICEPNATFGFIAYNGKFKYCRPASGGRHFPADDLYPSNDLYPGDGADILMEASDVDSAPVMGGLVYSDYYTHKITQARFVASENVESVVGGVAGNCYQFEDNVLLYGQTTTVLSGIITNFLRATMGFFYIPATVKGRARLWAEPGDMLGVNSGHDSVRFPIMKRVMTGITALYDEYSAQGEEYFTYSANSVYQRLTDVEKKTSDVAEDVSDVADDLSDEVDRATGAEEALEQAIEVSEGQIKSTIARSQKEWDTTGYNIQHFGYDTPENEGLDPTTSRGFYLNQTNGYLYYSGTTYGQWTYITTLPSIQTSVESQIVQTADSIKSTVAGTQKEWDTTGYNVSYFGYDTPGAVYEAAGHVGYYLNQTSGGLYYSNGSTWSYVTQLQSVQASLSSEITQEVNGLSLQVVHNGEISSKISLENNTISLSAGRLIINSGNFQLDSSGNATATNFTANDSFKIVGTESTSRLASISGQEICVYAGDSGSAKGNFRAKSIACDGGSLVFKTGVYVAATIDSSGNFDTTGKITTASGDIKTTSGDITTTNGKIKGKLYATDKSSTSSAANGYMNTSTGHVAYSTASSRRWKHDITEDISNELDPHKLYDLPVVQFTYNTDYLNDQLDKRYNKPVIGFIAEDVDKIYNVACDVDDYHIP